MTTETWPARPGALGDTDGPVFREPWQAQAFAMTLQLHEAGHFTWAEWSAALAVQIAAARARGEPDSGDTYYRHWLAALETLVAAKHLVGDEELRTRAADWAAAAARTPVGRPIELRAGTRDVDEPS